LISIASQVVTDRALMEVPEAATSR
jgi:hypothetical protein